MFTSSGSAATLYVWQESPSPAPPYTNWATAAHVIQDAVDAAAPGDTVLVTNGVYAGGGKAIHGTMTNRVALSDGVELRSVNGPVVTWIMGLGVGGGGTNSGDGAIRCVYVGTNAVLSGFTVTNGHTGTTGDILLEQCGGGAWCEPSGMITNCILIGNTAQRYGGGVYRGTLNRCALIGNRAFFGPGGADSVTLNNCTLTANFAPGSMFSPGFGGALFSTLNHCTLVGNRGLGAAESTLNNCILYFNSFGNYFGACTFNYSCTTPLPAGGTGNIDLDPLFVDTNGWSNLRLQSNSPCINAGKNAYITNSTDLDGNPRIVGGTVDLGAYEVQSPGSVLSYAWAQQYGLPTDGSADHTDADLDGHNNWQEWKAWTIPTDEFSVLKLLTPQPQTNGMLLRWQSVSGQNYFLERAPNLSAPFSILQSNIVGQSGTTSITDTNITGANSFFYRVGVP